MAKTHSTVPFRTPNGRRLTKATRSGPDHLPSRRQVRKLEARLLKTGWEPVYFQLHKTGLNHQQRRQYIGQRKNKALEDARRKKQDRGEFCGRKLERLIRCGAPLFEVNALKSEIRAFLHK